MARLEKDHKTYSSYNSPRLILPWLTRDFHFLLGATRAHPLAGCKRGSNNAGTQKIRRAIRQIDGWLTAS